MNKKYLLPFIASFLVMLPAAPLQGARLVSQKTITTQNKLTSSFKLKNGIPVIYRQIAGSDILQINYAFARGLKDLKGPKRVTDGIMFDAMASGAKGWPKEKLYATLEKFSGAVSCGNGIERGSCSLVTINSYSKKLMPLYAAVILQPTFVAKDVNNLVAQAIAGIRQQTQNPGSFVNEVVNRVFYPPGHPYRLDTEYKLKILPTIKPADLKAQHKPLLNASLHRITAVGSLPAGELKGMLNRHFGHLKGTPVAAKPVPEPVFDQKRTFELENRKIPTAYMSIKMNAPAISAKDYLDARLMFHILSEELGEEIRTKRSLSYSIYAYMINYSVGIGVIGATTSKPKETLEAIHQVLHKIKSRTYSKKEIEDYKTVFATRYFLTLEEHSSLAGALSRTGHYFGDAGHLYRMPRDLEAINPARIQSAARRYLRDFRVGVIFSKDKFKQKWADDLVKRHPSG